MIEAARKTLISAAALIALGLGTAQADIAAADKLFAEGNHKDALQAYVDAGGEGDVEATYRAAEMFETGQGTGGPKMDKAASWYQAAARAGHLGALNKLAEMFNEGRGVEQDKVQAWTLLNIAAQRGDTDAAARRDQIAADLRPGQIAAGERRTEKLASKYQGS
ncbi:MAG: tetratricopeptide repeat protein [Minwuia sp.]|uniref:tetratricopeptide repeat protein n=1 Tax=Minwuia sp. TaxID=2493630 RepID=UPI003A89AD02